VVSIEMCPPRSVSIREQRPGAHRDAANDTEGLDDAVAVDLERGGRHLLVHDHPLSR
jgi:hypothetical protein